MNEWKMEYSQNLFLDFCHFSISDANLLLNSISLSRVMDIGYIPLYEKVSLNYCIEHYLGVDKNFRHSFFCYGLSEKSKMLDVKTIVAQYNDVKSS